MGIATFWQRFERDAYDRAIGDARGDSWAWRMMRASSDRANTLSPVGSFRTPLWHALHVGLTGEFEGGEPPASYVVWTTAEPLTASFAEARFAHSAEDTRWIAEYLSTTNLDSVVANLCAAVELGVGVYKVRGGSDARVLVDSGAFANVYFAVREFYREAAARDQAVVVSRC